MTENRKDALWANAVARLAACTANIDKPYRLDLAVEPWMLDEADAFVARVAELAAPAAAAPPPPLDPNIRVDCAHCGTKQSRSMVVRQLHDAGHFGTNVARFAAAIFCRSCKLQVECIANDEETAQLRAMQAWPKALT